MKPTTAPNTKVLLLVISAALTSCTLSERVAVNFRAGRPLFIDPASSLPITQVAAVPERLRRQGADTASTAAPAALPMAAGVDERSWGARGKKKAKPETAKTNLYEWDGDDVNGRVNMVIDLSDQKARIYRGGRPVGWTYVATGKKGYRTPTGTYAVREKLRTKVSGSWGRVVNRNGATVVGDARNGRTKVPRGGRFVGAPMPYWMRVTGGIGMHAGNIPNAGSPASHGCIRLPQYMASKLFEVTTVGSSVRIVP